jgi:TonB-linked SusC/RagA family outer membrane protein
MRFILLKHPLALVMITNLFGLISAHAQSKKSIADTIPSSEAVQVVAYGTYAKRAVTSSVSTITGTDIEKNTVFSLGNALFGKVPGLILDQNSGEPGNDLPGISFRGVQTFGFSRAPLVLVDGFIRDLNSVSVFDVDKISVLKDASATAMYGIQAANGVILVTTKAGKMGKSKLTVDFTSGLQSPTRLPKFYHSANYAAMYNQALINDKLPALFTDADIAAFADGTNPLYPNVDWMGEMVAKQSPLSTLNISSSGGNNFATYYVSLGYLYNEGIYKNTNKNEGYSTNSDLDRINFRSNIDVRVIKDLTLKLNLGGQINDINAPRMATADIWNRLYEYPTHLFPVFAKDNLLGGTAAFPDNPYGYINNRGYRETHNRFFQSNLELKYDLGRFIKGLEAGARAGFDNYYTVTDGWSRTFAVHQLTKDPVSGNPLVSTPIGTTTNLTYNSPYNEAQNRRGTGEAYLRYAKKINSKSNISLLALYNQTRQIIGRENPFNMQSIGATIHFDHDNRFFADLTTSYGGTEAFAKGNRFGLFPAASAAYILIDKTGAKKSGILDYLKIRTSSGMVGSSNVGSRFAYRQLYVGGSSYTFGNTNAGVSTITEGTIANEGLTYERSLQYEFGVDARFFKQIDLNISLFQQDRDNILTSQSTTVPAFFGGILPNVNRGKVRNRGVEFSLAWNKKFRNGSFFTRFNMSIINDKVLQMAEELVPVGSEYAYRRGSAVFYTYGLDAIGFFQSESDIANSPRQIFGPVQPGDIKYRDRNNDGVVNNYDVGPIGNGSIPTKEFGLQLGFNIKGFDIQAMFQGQLDRNINLANYGNLFFPLRSSQKISTFVQRPWQPDRTIFADYPRLSTLENANNYRTSSFWLRNGDFIKLRSLEIGYNFNTRFSKAKNSAESRVFVRGMNVFTLDKFKYTDPENISGYPTMRSVNVGFKVQL